MTIRSCQFFLLFLKESKMNISPFEISSSIHICKLKYSVRSKHVSHLAEAADLAKTQYSRICGKIRILN